MGGHHLSRPEAMRRAPLESANVSARAAVNRDDTEFSTCKTNVQLRYDSASEGHTQVRYANRSSCAQNGVCCLTCLWKNRVLSGRKFPAVRRVGGADYATRTLSRVIKS